MCGLDTNSPDEGSGLSTEAVVLELHHGHGQVLRLIESRSASIDVDHELFPSRSDRRIEAFPRLEASAKTNGPDSAGSEEEPVAANHYTLSSGATGKRGEDQVEGRDDWQNLVGSILPGEET
jgi:hypothetical protein